MTFTIEIDREEDGRWIAEVPELPGVMVYGSTPREAVNRVLDLLEEVGTEITSTLALLIHFSCNPE